MVREGLKFDLKSTKNCQTKITMNFQGRWKYIFEFISLFRKKDTFDKNEIEIIVVYF